MTSLFIHAAEGIAVYELAKLAQSEFTPDAPPKYSFTARVFTEYSGPVDLSFSGESTFIKRLHLALQCAMEEGSGGEDV